MSGGGTGATAEEVAIFIERWRNSEGSERAAYAQFLKEFCDLIGVAPPDPPTSNPEAVSYRFEYPVKFPDAAGGSTTGRIDLYKKGAFVLEAKQSRLKGQCKELLPAQGRRSTSEADAMHVRGRPGADHGLDVLMLNARNQAERYAKALPTSHGWPPFIILCDVGHCFEFYADFTGQGKNYAQFPSRQRFRVYLEDLEDPAVRARIARIWTTPLDLDPARQAAAATRQIAKRLAAVSRMLEQRYLPEDVALFLMRCLFTMFAEDVGLLPKDSFKQLLRDCLDKPAAFKPLVEDLWRAMDHGGFCAGLRTTIKRFNGRLFAEPLVFALSREAIAELLIAAEHDWSKVDPSIFGALLEHALEPTERARLGAHYTPRSYVQRLVIETVIVPLRADWQAVLGAVQQARDEGNRRKALGLVDRFHEQLCNTRVLDPACGTGNFLHVAQELMKSLEGEVLEVATELGAMERLGGFAIRSVGPRQFFGLDLNRRAVAIADLMLWISYLQLHMRTESYAPREPILEQLKQIAHGDALLHWDDWPVPAVEGGREVAPRNPTSPAWPEAHFIVGNPPFIGGKDIRRRLGGCYVAALRIAYPGMNEGADLVMYWWDRAAKELARPGTMLRRFGFVTTNSITQLFQRRVVERHLAGQNPISLVMAIADHPWTKAGRDTAAVRIAMTVAVAGRHQGKLCEIVSEADLNTDQPQIEFRERRGWINAGLTIGADVSRAQALRANEGLASRGVPLHGAGFMITPAEASTLGLGRHAGLERHIRHYRNGRDLMARPRGRLVIDLDGLGSHEIRDCFPEVYQHLLRRVKPERDRNNEAYRRENWWLFGRRNTDMRSFTANLQRYIATVETAKHRVFQFLDSSILPDNKLIAVGLSDAHALGVLSSRIHESWYLASAGKLGIYERDAVYVKSRCFDPFPFPESTEPQKQAIRAPSEALDALRKQVLDAHPDLTLTKLYNVREALLAGHILTSVEEGIRDRGLVLIMNEHHDALDAAVAAAYGWPADLSDVDIVTRLVALNAERARDEARGEVRWLRPDYQRPRFARDGKGGEQIEAAELIAAAPLAAAKESFPAAPVERVAAVLATLANGSAPLSEDDIAKSFKQGLQIRLPVRGILVSLSRVGEISTGDGGRTFARRLTASG